MRKDLNKVMCENARVGHSNHYDQVRHIKDYTHYRDEEHFEELPLRESMKHRYHRGYGTKSFNEHLAPLRGLIRKNVGRKWDDVYSEICQVFDKRGVINDHIVIHLFQYVETNTRIGDNGAVYHFVSTIGWRRVDDDAYPEYYVHPETNILSKNDGEGYRQRSQQLAEQRTIERLKVHRIVDDTTELHKINGAWFEVKYEAVNGTRETKTSQRFSNPKKAYTYEVTVFPYRYDVIKKMLVTTNRVAVEKRQLSHKELKQYGLI